MVAIELIALEKAPLVVCERRLMEGHLIRYGTTLIDAFDQVAYCKPVPMGRCMKKEWDE